MKKVKKMGPIKPEKENKIFITGHISEDKIIKVIREIKFLESDNRFPEIFILLKSRGGKIFATHALCQVMKKCKKPIVITSSKAHSAAALILCCGTKGKRLIHQGSKVFIHEVKIHIDKSDNLISKIFWLIERKRLNKIDSKLLVKKTGQSFKKIVNDRKNKTYFTAQEALEYGFVDIII
ncbi:ATP-dependent Clp protease proteolytic subunit [Patescibacteria group bacterium]|nr:ATP-dependent Clp protease proteolytic subunit [Patescibacteria group bacterium]